MIHKHSTLVILALLIDPTATLWRTELQEVEELVRQASDRVRSDIMDSLLRALERNRLEAQADLRNVLADCIIQCKDKDA